MGKGEAAGAAREPESRTTSLQVPDSGEGHALTALVLPRHFVSTISPCTVKEAILPGFFTDSEGAFYTCQTSCSASTSEEAFSPESEGIAITDAGSI